MATRKNLGAPLGVEEWKQLDSAGDVKRFFRWCILSVRDQSLDARTAATLGQLGCYLLNAIGASDFERQLEVVKKKLDADVSQVENGTTTH